SFLKGWVRRSVATKADPRSGRVRVPRVRLSGTRTGELLDAVAARCERLVSRAVREPTERERQRRLIGLALVSPFLLAAPAAILLPPLVGIQAALGACAAIFAVSFLMATLVAATGRARFQEI